MVAVLLVNAKFQERPSLPWSAKLPHRTNETSLSYDRFNVHQPLHTVNIRWHWGSNSWHAGQELVTMTTRLPWPQKSKRFVAGVKVTPGQSEDMSSPI
ncbi:hypothetical protein TNCV_1184531 [Trichonephila clavipes]|nr:hypothetical protein TNCV_1184531 [Trichonephila clavipes]